MDGECRPTILTWLLLVALVAACASCCCGCWCAREDRGDRVLPVTIVDTQHQDRERLVPKVGILSPRPLTLQCQCQSLQE